MRRSPNHCNGPYLDSELDARTSLEIEQHLKSCPECARLLAEQQKLEARMKAGLNRGQRTAALWAELERSVTAAGCLTELPRPSSGRAQAGGWHSILQALTAQLQASLQPSRRAWAGLAAVWVVILALNLAAREPEGPRMAEKQLPPSSEVRFAVKQKLLLMAELATLSEPAPAEKARVAPPSPRSDRRKETLNT